MQAELGQASVRGIAARQAYVGISSVRTCGSGGMTDATRAREPTPSAMPLLSAVTGAVASIGEGALGAAEAWAVAMTVAIGEALASVAFETTGSAAGSRAKGLGGSDGSDARPEQSKARGLEACGTAAVPPAAAAPPPPEPPDAPPPPELLPAAGVDFAGAGVERRVSLGERRSKMLPPLLLRSLGLAPLLLPPPLLPPLPLLLARALLLLPLLPLLLLALLLL